MAIIFFTNTNCRKNIIKEMFKKCLTANQHSDAFFKFSLSSVPAGATIESATLKLYPTSAGSSSLQLKNLTSAFTDNATSETSPEIGSFILSGAFTAGGYNSLSNDDLKDLVQAWNDGTTTNHGLALVQEGTEDGTVVILSKENGDNPPMLRLEYTMP